MNFKNMKSIITIILIGFSTTIWSQNFKDEDWENLGNEEKKLILEYSNDACNCLSQYDEETEAYLSIIMKFSEIKRKGGTITPALEEEYATFKNECIPYFECLKKNTLTEDERQELKSVLSEIYGDFENELQVKKMRTQIISYVLKDQCGARTLALKSAMRFRLINMHIINAQNRDQKKEDE